MYVLVKKINNKVLLKLTVKERKPEIVRAYNCVLKTLDIFVPLDLEDVPYAVYCVGISKIDYEREVFGHIKFESIHKIYLQEDSETVQSTTSGCDLRERPTYTGIT